ncbi:MAG: hypothetical protein JWL84_2756 [Rhodospirillales bacterium]|nr:hypothetical protein [Rhodospirillales bacterium]
MAGFVVAFVGENANGILEWWTAEILKEIERAGLRTRLIDFMKPSWPDELADVLNNEKLTFAFSFQGMGAHISDQGENIWQKINVPFFTYLGDNPYHCPRLHWNTVPKTYLLYSCQDFLDSYTKYIKGPGAALLHPCAFPQNPHALQTPWHKRKFETVYVKTGVDPAQFTARWDTYPRQFRAILRNAAEIALGGSPETIADLCAAQCAAEGFDWGQRTELFCTLASDLDHYVRAERATKMARFLMKVPARIYGSGWDFLDRSDSRASFHDNIPADKLPALYANTKILVNTMPSVRLGMHERVIAGFLSRSAVLSDTNPYADSTLSAYPSFLGVDIDGADFEDQAMARLSLPSDVEDRLETSYRKARADFSLEGFVAALLELLAVVGLEERAVWFRAT